ncbi:MAG: amidase [Alphaproteobacteria bacterium]|jgi:aspartyl-tRNA(Asn)/glutamyl-tRNA(Gln) amidotransferase subunit A|nr:amidase [Alphaproteobacteria bacterium]
MPINGLPTVLELAADLAEGRTSSRALAEAALERATDTAGEGGRVFIKLDADAVRRQAEAADAIRAEGRVPSPLLGLPVSIKDLFDIAGQPTPAGSIVLADAAAATADAPVVARLRAAGAVLMGRTNMTEFAYSGLGVNPHHATPGNPHDRARVPGGSSAGAAVSVGDQMAVMGLGTDTGGSVRIPAAYCGISGFKPTQSRVPLAGCLPLSSSLDSIGPLAPSIACCAISDSLLAGTAVRLPEEIDIAGVRLGVVRNYVLDDMDDAVARAFEAALSRLAAAGARLSDVTLPALDEIPEMGAAGGLAAAEAYAWHRNLLARRGNDYDPRVGGRIQNGERISAADYIDLLEWRRRIIAETERRTRAFDAVVMPTTPILAPRLDEVASDDDYARRNLLSLRNTMVGNILDRCAATVPCQAPGELPVGFMAMGANGADHWLLDVAAAIEACLER